MCGCGNVKQITFIVAACLSAFEEFRKANICCAIRPSIRMGKLGFHKTDFHEILYLSIFPKSVEKIQVRLKCGKNSGCARLWCVALL